MSTDNIFDEKNIPESNWFKFDKVGDRISGELLGWTDRAAKDDFKPQRIYELKTSDDVIVKVPINLERDYVIGRANTARLGDTLGFEFKKEIPPSKKGFKPAKSIEVYVVKREKTADEVMDSI